MLLVADNLQIIYKNIEEAIKTLDPKPIQDLVKECEAAGAEAIDINSGPLSHDPAKKMAFLVEAIQAVSDLPVLLDTSNPKAIEAGLQANKKQAIINGFSLEPAKRDAILPLARKYETDIIGYLLSANGHVPSNEAERLHVAIELYKAFQQAGIDNQHLIIDPVVVPVMWHNGTEQAIEILSAVRNLPEVLGFAVRTIAALSNLTTGKGPLGAKLLLEKAYLPMLASSGLSMVLLNIFHHETVNIAKTCKLLTTPNIFTWEELT